MEELAKYLRAMLVLDIWRAQNSAARAETPPPRFELVLADSGFATKEIADLLGKSQAAVAKAISRGRVGRRTRAVDEQRESEANSDV